MLNSGIGIGEDGNNSFSQGNEAAGPYILKVQHLIERCLLLHMERDDIVRALETHAHIDPAITLVVWQELEKENGNFFKDYREAKSSVDRDSVIAMLSTYLSSQHENNNDDGEQSSNNYGVPSSSK